MKLGWTTLLMVAVMAAAGCATRSISNSGYQDGRSGTAYKGELSEFDVLAVNRDNAVSEEEIQKAIKHSAPVRVTKGSPVLVIQSGAAYPDAPMLKALNQHFLVTPFSGIPEARRSVGFQERDSTTYARSLRLVAARTGAEAILCYWGVLESGRENLETKAVSWVPIAGWFVPDEVQQMRIRLKVAIIDVRTGNWSIHSPEAFKNSSWSNNYRRASSDQKQVETLKAQAYVAVVHDLAERFID